MHLIINSLWKWEVIKLINMLLQSLANNTHGFEAHIWKIMQLFRVYRAVWYQMMDFLWALLGCLWKMMRKLNGRDEQGPPKRCGDLEGAWRVWKWGGSTSPFEGGEMKIKLGKE